jgi:predicted ATPase
LIKINDLDSNIQDVGLGVALQLPIIAQALIDNEYIISNIKGKILLIEQPEIHLHPRLQAKLIEVLVKYAPNNTYIIETHSEHIVRKLQVLVKEGSLQPEDVSINYLARGDGGSKTVKHNILPNGQMETPFPKGFYDNTYTLFKALLD